MTAADTLHGKGATRETYVARFESAIDAANFEERVLGIGSEFLPPCAIAVRDGGEPTPEYWAFLCEQIDAVRDEAQTMPLSVPWDEAQETALSKLASERRGTS